jgi:hypothetical protein
MVSPIAHRLLDLAAGHCSVSVLLHTPESSRAKWPEDSAPAMDVTTNFDERTSLGITEGEISGA